jgi:hypothetical protein
MTKMNWDRVNRENRALAHRTISVNDGLSEHPKKKKKKRTQARGGTTYVAPKCIKCGQVARKGTKLCGPCSSKAPQASRPKSGSATRRQLVDLARLTG